MEHVLESADQFGEILVSYGSKIALKRAVVPYKEDYNDAGTVSMSEYSFDVPRCHTLEEFQAEFNKNKLLKATFDENRWTVKPKKNIFGESGEIVNTYEDSDKNRRRIEFRDPNYFLLDEKNLKLSDDYFYWKAGELLDVNMYKPITSVNSISVVPFGNSMSLAGSSFYFGKINSGTSEMTDITPDKDLSILGDDAQDQKIYLEEGDFYVSEQKFPGRFIFELHGLGEGFIMQSCIVSVVRKHTDTPFCSFRIRAGQLIQ